MKNQRLQAAEEAVKAAQARVAEIENDLATRGEDPAFQTAERLFKLGWRYWNTPPCFSGEEEEDHLTFCGVRAPLWAGEGEEILGMPESDIYQVLQHLENLTKERPDVPYPCPEA